SGQQARILNCSARERAPGHPCPRRMAMRIQLKPLGAVALIVALMELAHASAAVAAPGSNGNAFGLHKQTTTTTTSTTTTTTTKPSTTTTTTSSTTTSTAPPTTTSTTSPTTTSTTPSTTTTTAPSTTT